MLIRRVLLPLLTLFGLVILARYSVVLALADASFREDTVDSAKAAIHLAPSSASYHALLAELIEAEGANPDAELETATNLSPHESRYWIRRAFRAEVEQKYDESERFLKKAYEVDRGFDPRWALMNYYFRRGRFAEFWKSAAEALQMSYGDLDPIFRLCLAADSDPQHTARILPARRNIRFAYFTYLIQHKQFQSAGDLAGEMASGAGPEDVPVLIDYCTRQMGHNNSSSLAVWNILCRRHLVAFSELAPERGQIITNGDLAAESSQQGFDWKYGAGAGIAITPMHSAQGVSIEINGDQPDLATILAEEVPLTQGKQYILSYNYRLIGDQPNSGLEWVIERTGKDGVAGASPIATSSALSAKDWSTGQMTFSAGQQDGARLVLQYRRVPGTVRWKGTVKIRHVASQLAQPAFSAGTSLSLRK